MRKLLGMCVLLALISLLVAACGSSTSNTPSATTTPTSGTTPTLTSGNNTVGLAAMTFAPNSITIKKGDSIALKNQTATVHIISNGSWNGNAPTPKTEPGAPVVSNMTFNTNGQSQMLGPFDTAGTFHYYCSVHPGMNLTVTVQ